MAKRFELAKKYTKQYQDSLLPCGVCGNTDVRVVSDRSIFGARDTWSVCCSTHGCDCTGPYTSVKEAVRRWNEMQERRLDHGEETAGRREAADAV